MLKIKSLFLMCVFLCLANGIAAASADNAGAGECRYIAPSQPANDAFFHDMIAHANDESETFAGILSHLEEEAASWHRFQFKYPLKSSDHAKIFAKTLQIKAQEAHRFVPVISHSQYISANHLGFIRHITIKDNGPTIQEHVLVDQDANRVIFIEEFILDANGESHVGSFVALNQVIEEDGSWYFAGTYLYPREPDTDKIFETMHMFRDTYEKMMSFIEDEDVDAVYESIQVKF